MFRKIASAVAVAACFAAPAAQADTVLFSGFSEGSEQVNVTTTARTGMLPAGGLDTSLNGGPSFTTYCVDLVNTINFGTLYTDYAQVPGASYFSLDPSAYADLRQLFGLAPNPTGAAMEAAFQVVVWEIVYETLDGTLDLGSGNATFSGLSASALNQANAWISVLNGPGSGPELTVLNSPSAQDVIYAPIPEPETYAMMIAGLAGLAAVAKRRRKTAQAKAAA